MRELCRFKIFYFAWDSSSLHHGLWKKNSTSWIGRFRHINSSLKTEPVSVRTWLINCSMNTELNALMGKWFDNQTKTCFRNEGRWRELCYELTYGNMVNHEESTHYSQFELSWFLAINHLHKKIACKEVCCSAIKCVVLPVKGSYGQFWAELTLAVQVKLGFGLCGYIIDVQDNLTAWMW